MPPESEAHHIATAPEPDAVRDCVADCLSIESAERVRYREGEIVLHVGQPVGEILLGLRGELRVARPGREPVVLRAPFLIDRWMADSFGHSVLSAVAWRPITGMTLASSDRPRLLGLAPLLRQVSVRQRAMVLGHRDHLPQSSRSSM